MVGFSFFCNTLFAMSINILEASGLFGFEGGEFHDEKKDWLFKYLMW